MFVACSVGEAEGAAQSLVQAVQASGSQLRAAFFLNSPKVFYNKPLALLSYNRCPRFYQTKNGVHHKNTEQSSSELAGTLVHVDGLFR